jgi:hypothetical protein
LTRLENIGDGQVRPSTQEMRMHGAGMVSHLKELVAIELLVLVAVVAGITRGVLGGRRRRRIRERHRAGYRSSIPS